MNAVGVGVAAGRGGMPSSAFHLVKVDGRVEYRVHKVDCETQSASRSSQGV